MPKGFRMDMKGAGGKWRDNPQSGISKFNNFWELDKNAILKSSDFLKTTSQ